jgi:two-component system sensor histidine kinase ResE
MSDAVRVLLVDSDAEDSRLTAGALAAAGFVVTSARSGAEAIEALGRDPGEVVLLELRLPDMDGARLLERLAAAAMPAVVLTGVDDVRAAVDAMQRGARDYVVKRSDGAHLRALPAVVARTVERLTGPNPERDGVEIATLAATLAETTDGVLVLDADGRIRFVSRALAVAWREREAAIVGRPVSDFVVPADGEPPLDRLLAAVQAQERWSGLLRAGEGEANERVWDVRVSPFAGAAGAAAIGVFRDVSERHALEQLRADFLSMITHDIKVPLTVILGYTEMLTDPEPPHDQIPPDILTRIRESGEKIHALVCNFLDLSRIEAGRLTIDPRPCDLHAMLTHALEQHGASARRKGIVLALEADVVPPLLADEPQLERVVTNLLANAIKYTPSGGQITIVTGRENGRVTVAFRDTGRGIPADELPHLFEKYRRVREAKRTEGTGLGLFIAKTIVDAHGGDIRVESEPGAGSTFTLLLPAA